MKRTQQSLILTGLLAALALAGCSATPSGANSDQLGTASNTMGATPGGTMGATTGTSDSAGAIGSSNASGATAGNMGAENREGTSAGSMTEAPGATGTSRAQGMVASNAVVITVESMPRQSAGVAADSAVGSSGSVGKTGSSMGDDKMYRITLRMDDGTTRVVTQEKSPSFGAGDRVNMTDGAISNVP